MCAGIRAPGVSAGVLLPGGERWTAASGVADVGLGVPMISSTPLRIGSITKTFTATATVVLAERGALDLDDPAVEHLPELRALRTDAHPLAAVTIRRLLVHRSGLVGEPPTRDWLAYPFPSIGEVLDHIDLARIAIAPGSAFKYSNLGYALLGEVVARASGQSYERFVQTALLEPAGMIATTFAAPLGAARGYGAGPDASWQEQAAQELGAERPGGGMWSTAGDLLRWAEVALGRVPAVVSSAAADALTRPETSDDSACDRALGWQLARSGERVLRGHGGRVNGFAAHLVLDASAGTAAVVLTNGQMPPEAACLALLGADAPPVSPNPCLVPRAAEDPVGTYTGPLDTVVSIEQRDTALWLSGGLADAASGALLDPVGEDRLLVRAGRFAGEELVLERGPGSTVAAFTVAGWRHVRSRVVER
ncbi:MAG: serine hydrolase domain-containing protein [Conexibacter sp.]